MRFEKATLVKVLLFSAVCIAMTVVLGLRLANTRLFADRVKYEAEFSNAAGVIKGDSVKVAGVDVGRVSGTRIEDGKAIVEFAVNRDVAIPSDSRAAVRWRNVLGQRFMYVFPGSADDLLTEGGRIPVDRTDAAGDIGALLNNAGPILRAIDPEKANLFLESVNTALSGNEIAASQLIDNSASLAADLSEIKEDIGSVVENSDEVLSAFASQDDALHAILRDLNSLGGSLQRSTGDLNTVITDFAAVQKHLDDLVTENSDTIDATLRDLDSVAGTLAENKRNLARTLCTLPIGVAGYFQTTSWGEWFNVRITEVLIQDNESNRIVHEKETPRQRAAEQPTPGFTDCGRKKFSAPGSATSASGRDGAATEGAEGILRFLLTGDSGA